MWFWLCLQAMGLVLAYCLNIHVNIINNITRTGGVQGFLRYRACEVQKVLKLFQHSFVVLYHLFFASTMENY